MNDILNIIDKIGNVKNFTNLPYKDINEINKAIKLVNQFNVNISKYAKHIYDTEYVFTINELRVKLSPRDFSKLHFYDESEDTSYVYCYASNSVSSDGPISYGYYSTGDIGNYSRSYTFDENNMLAITTEWTSRHTRMSHVPYINRQHVITIDLLSKKINSITGENYLIPR